MGVQSTVIPDGPDKDWPRLTSIGNHWVRPNRDFFLLSPGPAKDEDQEAYEAELSEFGVWLVKHPAVRDNNRIFFPSARFPRGTTQR